MMDRASLCTAASPDITARLRAETRDAHYRIESTMSALLFASSFDLNAYHKMLLLYRNYYQHAESLLKQFDSVAALLCERGKIAWIEADIDYLCGLHIAHKKVSIPPGLHFPTTESQAWGFLYVFEGATLGAGHILDKLRHRPCFKGSRGLRFFSGYGRHTPAMWRQFQRCLTQYVETHPGCENAIINGANASFANMSLLMQGVSVVETI